jgi:hypothetical protein
VYLPEAAVFERDLASSPDIASGKIPLTPLWDNASVPVRYACAMERADADILVFAHGDVYFPSGWFDRLASQLIRLDALDPNWAVASTLGRTRSGGWVGRVWDSGLRRIVGNAIDAPVPIIALDELAFIVRRAADVSFDQHIPTDIHFYGTDLVLEAARLGKTSYGLDLPLVHNSKPVLRFPPNYVSAYNYMTKKWRAQLPVPTTTVPLVPNPWHLRFRRLRIRYKAIFRRSTYFVDRLPDPRAKAIELGFEKAVASSEHPAYLPPSTPPT